MKKPDNEQSRLKEFLKDKPNPSSTTQKSQQPNPQTRQAMLNEIHKGKRAGSKFDWNRLRARFGLKLLDYQTYMRVPSNQHRIALTLFTITATYICYRMQESFDRMREKVRYSQTYKKDQIQKEKQYLDKMLFKGEFQAVPIGKDYQPQFNYKFQEDQISTKDDLMEIMKEDYDRGIAPPQQYRREFFEKYPDRKK